MTTDRYSHVKRRNAEEKAIENLLWMQDEHGTKEAYSSDCSTERSC